MQVTITPETQALRSHLITKRPASLAWTLRGVVHAFFYPKIMADSVDVHPAEIIAAMMVGYAAKDGFAS